MGIFNLFGSSLKPYEEFHENGKLKTKGNKDSKGQISGLVQNFSEKGFLTYESIYVKGNKDGIEKEFYESGEIKITRNFKSNLLDGEVNSFTESGKITSKYQYKNGLLHGEYFLFDENEDINESGLFINDEKVDILTKKPIYDKDGFRDEEIEGDRDSHENFIGKVNRYLTKDKDYRIFCAEVIKVPNPNVPIYSTRESAKVFMKVGILKSYDVFLLDKKHEVYEETIKQTEYNEMVL